MENVDEPLPGNLPAGSQVKNEETPVSSQDGFVYPPKFDKPEQTANIWLKSFFSLALYLVLGSYIFQGRFDMLLMLTAIVVFHELGHLFAMKFFRYKDLGIFLFPYSVLMFPEQKGKYHKKNPPSFYWRDRSRVLFLALSCICSMKTIRSLKLPAFLIIRSPYRWSY